MSPKMSTMTTPLQDIINFHNYISYDVPGIPKLILPYPLMGSVLPTLAIVFLYVYFCKKLGPKFMKNRQPYSLKTAMILYNIFQVFVNLYLFLWSLYEFANGWKMGINLICFFRNENMNAHVDDETFSIIEGKVHFISYLYFLVKISDLMDTVFMVLRKNFHQVSVLHLYHHASMPLIVGFCIKYLPPTQNVHAAVPNMFVHVLVYGYYLVTSFAPEVKKSIRIKKLITITQLCQFVYIQAMVVLISNQKYCPVSMFMTYLLSFQAIMMIFMFSNFYYQTYIRKNRKSD